MEQRAAQREMIIFNIFKMIIFNSVVVTTTTEFFDSAREFA